MQETECDKMNHNNNMKPQPREERLRIPGKNQASQLKTKCQPNVHLVPRKSLSYSRLQGDEDGLPKTPRVVTTPLSNNWDGKDEAGRRQLPLRKASLGSPTSQDSSMGILDYYLRDPSPSPLSITTSTPQTVRPGTQERQQVDGAAIAAFDFGLSTSKSNPKPASSDNKSIPKPTQTTEITVPKSRFSKPLPTPPVTTRCQYTLFPKDLPSNPSTPTTPTAMSFSSETSTLTNSPVLQEPGTHPTRPRKASLASSSSLRSRSDSCTSIRLLPSATFTSPPPPAAPPSQKQVPKPLRLRTLTQSSGTSTSSHRQQTSISIAPPSRWSGDTVEVPLTPPPLSAGAAESSSPSSPPWPQGSFFEDDEDDESMPLRKKVVEKIRASRVKEIQPGGIGCKKTVAEEKGGFKGWTGKWLACGCKRK